MCAFGHRVDERPVLEKKPLGEEQPAKVRGPEAAAQPAPEDQVLAACRRRGRIDLQEAEAADHIQYVPWPLCI